MKKTIKRRLAAFSLAAVMAVGNAAASTGGLTAMAAQGAYRPITSWEELGELMQQGGNGRLQGNIKAAAGDSYLTVGAGKNVSLDLNGFRLDRGLGKGSDSSGYVISNLGALVIEDSGENATGVITGGCAGAISNKGDLTIDGGSVQDNNGDNGGAITSIGGSVTINAGEISGNRAQLGGAIYAKSARVMLNGGEITSNAASAQGGALYAVDCDVRVNEGSIEYNVADTGAGIYAAGSSSSYLLFRGGTVANNSALKNGGGICIQAAGNSFSAEITGGKINSNTAQQKGAGVYADGCELSLSGSLISGNKAAQAAGVYCSGDIKVNDSPIVWDNIDTNDQQSNICAGGKLITGTLFEGAKLGIYAEDMSAFTQGYTANNSKQPSEFFVSDKGLHVVLSGDEAAFEGHVFGGAPKWEWSQDHKSAKAYFSCAKCSETLACEAEIKMSQADGKITYTASVVFSGATFTDTKVLGAPQDKYSVTVGSDIKMNIWLDAESRFGNSFSDNAKAVVTCMDAQSQTPKQIRKVFPLKEAVLEDGAVKITVDVSFAQIADRIKVELYGNDGNAVTFKNGSTQLDISVEDFCGELIRDEKTYGKKYADAAKAIVNYGKAAQEFFGWKGAAVTTASVVKTADWSKIASQMRFTAGTKLGSVYSLNFRALSSTELSVTFSGDASGVSVTSARIGGGNVTSNMILEKCGSRWKLRIKGLTANALDEPVNLVFSDGTKLSLSTYDYIREILKNSVDDTSKKLVSALYYYSQAASAV